MHRRFGPAAAALLAVAGANGLVAPARPASAQSPTATQTTPPAGTPSAKPAVPQGTSAVVMDLSALESVIGKGVKSASGEDLGRIVDLLVTTSGQVRAAVIDFGGILGVGSRKVAVDWKALDFANFTKDGTVRLALTRNQVRVSPEYKSGDPVVILQAPRPDEAKPAPSDNAGPSPPAATPGTGAQGDAHK